MLSFIRKRPFLFLFPLSVIFVLTSFYFFLFVRRTDIIQATAQNKATISINGIDSNIPLFENVLGDVLIRNKVQTSIPNGEYNFNLYIDGVGRINQSVSIQDGSNTTFEFNPVVENSEESTYSAKPLSSLSSTIRGSLPFEPNTNTQAVIYNLSTGNILVFESQDGDSDYYSRTLRLVSKGGESKDISTSCNVFDAKFNRDATKIRYFQVCGDDKNGLFSYDIATGENIRLLTSADPYNILRIDVHPTKDEVIYVKKNQELGFIRDGIVTVIQENSPYSAPRFTPDGEGVILFSPAEGADQTEKLLDVIYVSYNDVTTSKKDAPKRIIGKTFDSQEFVWINYIVVDWISQTEFRAGESGEVFSILTNEEAIKEERQTPLIPDVDDDGSAKENKRQLKREISSVGGKYRVGYRFLARVIENEGKEETIQLSTIGSLYEVNNNVYGLENGGLYRIRNDEKVLTSSRRVLFADDSNGVLTIVYDNGEIVDYADSTVQNSSETTINKENLQP